MEAEKNLMAALAEIVPTVATAELPLADEQTPHRKQLDHVRHGAHYSILCLPQQVLDIAQLMDAQGFLLESIAGVDWLEQGKLELLYDYSRFTPPQCRVLVRCFVPRDQARLPSISSCFSGADWHERETFDFYGIVFEGHPNLSRILLPEDADFHPLLKDYSA